MKREMVLKIALSLVGLLFLAMASFMVAFIRSEPALAMMMCVYTTLGVFLLLAVRNPSAHRSLIAFTAWSSLAHATLMAIQEWMHAIAPRELMGVGVFYLIGAALLVLAPGKRVERPVAVGV